MVKCNVPMSVVAFLVVFVITLAMQRWLHQHIQAFAFALTGNPGCAIRLLFYLVLPGVYLHELSHYLAAKILFVPVRKFHVGIGAGRGEQVSLGFVQMTRPDPVRESLIGAAPFAFGISAIWLIANWGFGLNGAAGASYAELLARVREYANDWTTWFDLYLIFAVSTSMIPSESDREPWGLVLAVLGTLIVIAILFGWAPRVPANWVTLAQRALDALTFSLGIAAIVNGVIAVFLLILERTIETIRGQRVEFRVRKK